MDISSGLGLVAVAFLVLVNGFFVATEFSIVAVRRSRLEEMATKGDLRAKAAIDIVTHLDIYLAACQLGITMVSLALGWIGEPALASLIEPAVERIFGSFAPALGHVIAIAIAFTLITALHIVVGELAPKGLALQKAEGTTLFIAGPIRVFYLIFKWPTRFLNSVGIGLLRLLGLKPATETDLVRSVGELQVELQFMQEAGVVTDQEVQFVNRVFSAARCNVCEIMTPRTAIVGIDKGMTLAQFLEFNARQTFSCFPVIGDSLDAIVGTLSVKEVLRALGDEQLSESDSVSRLARPVYYVPKTKDILDLMDEMRREGRTIALVTDEFGGVSGMITFKQLVGEIVGRVKQEGTEEPIRRLKDGTAQLDGATRIRDANASLSLDLPSSRQYDTVAGLVLARLGRIPRQGEFITVGRLRIEVAELRGPRITKVNVIWTPPP